MTFKAWKHKLKSLFAFAKTSTTLNKFRQVLEQAPGVVLIIDKQLNFEFINPYFTKLTGYTEADVLGKNIIELFPGRLPYNDIINHFQTHERWQGELATWHKTGEARPTNALISTYKDETGENQGYIIILQDISERKSMENALNESENLYRTLIEKSLEGVALSQNGKILLANKAFCKMFGYEMHEIQNISPESLIAPEDRERVVNIHFSRMRGELDTLNYSATFLHRSGRKLTIELNSTTVQVNGQNASFITMHDITERIAIEQALRESESKYKTLVESSQDGITIICDNRILYANKTYCKMLGYTTEELYNMPAVNTLHPSEHAKAIKIAERRKNLDFSTINQVFLMLNKDGKIIECETSSTLIKYDGQWASFFTSHDITESKRMQLELEKSEEKYRQLVETTNSIILKWDRNFRITFLNEYGLKFFGYSKEELFSNHMVGTIIPHSEQYTGRNLAALMEDIFLDPEKYAQNINENMKKNGERVWVSWNNTAIRDESGEIINMFSIGTDITERKRNEEELKITKGKLEELNLTLEKKVIETAEKLTEVNTQLFRLQKENLQSQFDVLRQQVNPHFLFNSLNVLTSLIKLEPDLAEKFSEHLSKVYRYVLENKDNELVDLKTELHFLDAYIFLLNIRFVDKLKVNINIPENWLNDQIIPLAMQLLIENAIKHNVMSKSVPLTIDIFIDNDHYLNVVNNLNERPSQLISTGVGLKNIQNRYLLLNNTQPAFEKTSTHFIAKVPLVQLEKEMNN